MDIDLSTPFRIIGQDSNKAVVSRVGPEPTLLQEDFKKDANDQLFMLQKTPKQSDPEYADYYYIVSTTTGKLLFSRTDGDTKVGHIPRPEVPQDCTFFRIEPHGAYTFRALSKTGLALVSSPKSDEITNENWDNNSLTSFFRTESECGRACAT